MQRYLVIILFSSGLLFFTSCSNTTPSAIQSKTSSDESGSTSVDNAGKPASYQLSKATSMDIKNTNISISNYDTSRIPKNAFKQNEK